MKKSNLVISLAALGLAVVAAPASAQFFAGLGAGKSYSNASNYSSGGVSVSGFDSNETSFQGFGGYMFDKTWGVQVQYTDLGSRNGTVCAGGACAQTGDVKAYQWGVAGIGKFDLGSDFFVQGKLGLSSNHVDGVGGTVGGVAYNSSGGDKTDVLAGIAVGYQWTKNFSSRLEYEYFGKAGNSDIKASNLGLRMQYNFD